MATGKSFYELYKDNLKKKPAMVDMQMKKEKILKQFSLLKLAFIKEVYNFATSTARDIKELLEKEENLRDYDLEDIDVDIINFTLAMLLYELCYYDESEVITIELAKKYNHPVFYAVCGCIKYINVNFIGCVEMLDISLTKMIDDFWEIHTFTWPGTNCKITNLPIDKVLDHILAYIAHSDGAPEPGSVDLKRFQEHAKKERQRMQRLFNDEETIQYREMYKPNSNLRDILRKDIIPYTWEIIDKMFRFKQFEKKHSNMWHNIPKHFVSLDFQLKVKIEELDKLNERERVLTSCTKRKLDKNRKSGNATSKKELTKKDGKDGDVITFYVERKDSVENTGSTTKKKKNYKESDSMKDTLQAIFTRGYRRSLEEYERSLEDDVDNKIKSSIEINEVPTITENKNASNAVVKTNFKTKSVQANCKLPTTNQQTQTQVIKSLYRDKSTQTQVKIEEVDALREKLAAKDKEIESLKAALQDEKKKNAQLQTKMKTNEKNAKDAEQLKAHEKELLKEVATLRNQNKKNTEIVHNYESKINELRLRVNQISTSNYEQETFFKTILRNAFDKIYGMQKNMCKNVKERSEITNAIIEMVRDDLQSLGLEDDVRLIIKGWDDIRGRATATEYLVDQTYHQTCRYIQEGKFNDLLEITLIDCAILESPNLVLDLIPRLLPLCKTERPPTFNLNRNYPPPNHFDPIPMPPNAANLLQSQLPPRFNPSVPPPPLPPNRNGGPVPDMWDYTNNASGTSQYVNYVPPSQNQNQPRNSQNVAFQEYTRLNHNWNVLQKQKIEQRERCLRLIDSIHKELPNCGRSLIMKCVNESMRANGNKLPEPDVVKEMIKVKVMSASNEQGEDLETIVSRTREDDDPDSCCPICLEACVTEVKILRCSHRYHHKCISDWLMNNRICPVCRQHVVMDDDFPPLT